LAQLEALAEARGLDWVEVDLAELVASAGRS